MKVLASFLVFLSYFLLINGKELEVTINQGVVKGYKHATRSVYEFHGIPYATAPTGHDKFKAPLPVPKWEGTLDAVDNMIICPQLMDNIEFTEQCLVVNIFVPEINEGLKPVVIYIHGGGFVVGAGNMGLPYNLVERDIVAVTFNYRLGVHGFLCLNTETIPGNVGLKDQLAALRWVKQNIREFGGDPSEITLAGFSAGSASAELWMLSQFSGDLFHKVVLESGNAIASWGVNPDGEELAKAIASENGLNDVENITNVEQFYLSMSYEELLSLVPNDFTELKFGPCIEHDHGNDEAIITERPISILLRGDYAKVPLLTGYTDSEGLMLYERRDIMMADMNEKLTNRLPPNFFYYTKMDDEEITGLVKNYYFNDTDTITDNSIREFIDFITDSYFAYWCIKSAELHALNSVPVYLYEYSYMTSTKRNLYSDLGATHCSQTDMILELLEVNGLTEILDDNDKLMQNITVNLWVNFIKNGEPVSPGSPYYWEPLDPKRLNYFRINYNLENKESPLEERLKLWEKIYTPLQIGS